MTLFDLQNIDADYLFANADRCFVRQGMFTVPPPGSEEWSVFGTFSDTTMDIGFHGTVTSQEVRFAIRLSAAQEAVDALTIPTLPAKGWELSVTLNNIVRNFVVARVLPNTTLGFIVFELREK